MKNVKLNFLLMFFLILGLSYQGYADCPIFVKSNTEIEAAANKTGKGLKNFFSFNWSNLDFDEKLLQFIKVTAVNNQGPEGYFDPKIKVCDYEGNDNCYILSSGTSCRQIYGTQSTGGGVSAAVFIDWEGDKTSVNAKIADSLEWEWAEDVTDEEKKKFANSPKICACSQKGACMDAFSGGLSRILSGANIFRPGDMENVCDTCSWSKGKQKIKCAPVPLAPGPPPLCEQLAMSLPQVRIVPITDKDNDYFNPKVKVIAGDLIEEDGKIGKELDFPKGYGENKAEWRSILDKNGIMYYFKTYREKDKLCAKYHGTQGIDEKSLQFIRCFPAPPAPEPEVVEIVQSNASGKQSDTLKIRMKMSESTCTYRAHGVYSNSSCTFNVTNHPVNLGPLSLKVVKPAIVAKTTDSNNTKSYIDNIIEGILESNPQQFKVLKEYGYVPDIETGCKEFQGNKCKLNNLEQPEIEVKYKGNSNSKMLCLSGWQPEPEEFVLEREGKIVPLKLMGTKYIKYNTVYSKESNQFYYLPSKEIVDLLKRPQDQLDKIIFNKQGYVFFSDEDKQEKGKCSYCVTRNDEIDDAFKSSKGLKVVYKLTDVEQYLDKEDNSPFYLEHEEVDCKHKDGKVLRDEKNEVQKCIQLKDQPIKADRTEVFYADKLCMFDLEGLKEKVKEIIKKQLESKKQELEKKSEKSYDPESKDVYTDNLSVMFDRVEIEAWGSGEAGHIADEALSTESRLGMPGDYIKAKLKIDPDYPIIKVQVTEGGGNRETHLTDKDGGPIFIKKCRLDKRMCKDLITIAGGGKYKMYGNVDYKETVIHERDLKPEDKIVKVDKLGPTQDNQIAYIENGKIKYEIIECKSGLRSNKPGAGGCIDKNKEIHDKNSPRHMQKGIYGKGSPGYVKIRPIMKEFDEEEINAAIKKVIEDQ